MIKEVRYKRNLVNLKCVKGAIYFGSYENPCDCGDQGCVNQATFEDNLKELENFIEQIISERGKEIIKMLENTDVQMSVNGDVSQDEIAMAKFIYKAHIKHIIKKIGSAIISPNPINGTLPSETDSAIK